MPDITATTRVIAIIGDPVAHSLTPRIQNAAWDAQKTSNENSKVVNVAFRIAPETLAQTVEAVQKMGFLGLMVTIPHKEKVLSLCDELDQTAQDVNACNLVHFHKSGKVVGYSSDGWAAQKSLEEEGVVLKGARISILGGGGGARSLALRFARIGIKRLRILNRTVERAEKIVAEVKELAPQLDALALPSQKSTFAAALPETDVFINATSIGMHPHVDDIPLNARLLELLPLESTVYDIVYNPLETRLLAKAKERGLRTVDGLGMLIYTNVFAGQICAKADLSAKVMRREALAALEKKRSAAKE